MREKALVEAIKNASKNVRKLDHQSQLARTERAKAFLEGANAGMTYEELAELSGVSIHTVQADLRMARRLS